jgi:hypothetical protein
VIKGTYQIENQGYTCNLHTYPSALKGEKDGEQEEERTIMWRHSEFIGCDCRDFQWSIAYKWYSELS